MLDSSQYSDADILQAAGLSGQTAPVDSAILNQESGNNPNAPTSIDGAVGQSQIIPATFARFAHPGEDIHNPADNLAVGQRYRDYLKTRFNNDPARVATAYFSGEGNVAPAGSPTPWLKDKQDGNGKSVSGYVSDVLGRMGNAIIPSASAEDAPQNTQPPAQVPTVSGANQPSNNSQPSAVPNSGGTQNAIDPSQYSDADILQAAGIAPSKPTASAKQPSSALGSLWDLLSKGTDASIKGGAQLESNIIAPFLSEDSKQKLRDAGLYDVKHPEIKNGFARSVAESPLGAYSQAVYSGIGAPVAPVIQGAGELARKDGVPQSALDLLGAGATIAGVAGPGNPTAKSSVAPAVGGLVDWLNANDIGGGGGTAGRVPATSILNDTSGVPIKAESIPESIKTTDSGKPLDLSPRTQGEGMADLTKFLANDGIDLNKVADDLEAAQKIDPHARAIDVMAQEQDGIPGAPNVLGLAKSIAQSPGVGRSLAAEMVKRGYTATQDIGNSFNRGLSGSDFYNIKNDAIQSKEGTGPLYDAAYSHPGNQNVQSPVINRILKTDAGKSALQYAAKRINADMSQMVKPDPELAAQAKLAGQAVRGGVGKGLKLQTYQYIKEGFDEQISKAYRAGENGLGSSLTAQKNTLINQLDSFDATKSNGQPGAYAQARKTYSTAAKIQEAADNGRKFMSQDPEAIKNLFENDNISAPEKKAYAAGAGRAFQDMLDRVRDGSNPVQTVWTESLRKRLEPMMTKDAFKQLSAEMALHQVKSRVNKIVTGSDTAANQSFAQKPPSTVAGSALRMLGNSLEPGMIIGKLGDIADKALQKQAEKMTEGSKAVAMRYLTTKDPEAIRFLARNQKQAQQRPIRIGLSLKRKGE